MRLSTAAVLASALGSTLAASPVTDPWTGPFYLTFVTTNGTEYAADIATVSRGAQAFSSSKIYDTVFAYDPETERMTDYDNPYIGGSSRMLPDEPVWFTADPEEYTPGSEIVQVTEVNTDSGVEERFFIKHDTIQDGTFGWKSYTPREDGLPINVYWVGVGGNSQLRLDLELPAKR
ncbi:hypothetical protein GMORB2_6923 [Geosmithia morbida]|uniref:Uncharacterized protein n=1 Tax=Geosmithia morbida TaxID=1094350 RepID=A0A9P4YT35_9HYPO|nr:uncharacterized protein GMORB2_6923 [Geosmithia morbida]KAF4122616.1 hypothetical protein GMORB2_6923 [Geosmithia morbida]